jgi:hypothetical protein
MEKNHPEAAALPDLADRSGEMVLCAACLFADTTTFATDENIIIFVRVSRPPTTGERRRLRDETKILSLLQA